MIGINLARQLRQRVFELCQLEHSLVYISGELQYRHSILADVFGKASLRSCKPFSKWFAYLQDELNESNASSVYDIWTSSVQKLSQYTKLRKSDIAILQTLGLSLGRVDLETQLKEFSIITEQIHDVRVLEERNLTNKMKVASTVCIVAAILIVVAFI